MASPLLTPRYDQLTRIGEGTYGVVYQARDRWLKRTVAAKVLKAALEEAELAGFRNEAQTQANLAHPNIVTVFDIARTDDVAFITMEFALGGTVADAQTRGGYPPSRVAEVITDAAAGLDYAHAKELIHRDVKPSNLLVTGEGRVMVGDFGLAREIGRDTTNLNAGTLVYMAPEQMTVGKGLTPAADVFALAVTAYELLTGRHHGGFLAISAGNNPPTASQITSNVSPTVDAVLEAALTTDPAQRTPTPGAFASALTAALAKPKTRATRGRRVPQAEPAAPAKRKPPRSVSQPIAQASGALTCIGVEWSGSAKERDAAKSIWTAVVKNGVLTSLTTGQGRLATADALIEYASPGNPVAVGVDFAFSVPTWYLDEQGFESAAKLWDALARMEVDQGAESQWPRSLPLPFWGPRVRPKPELGPGATWFRRTEDETRAYTRANPKSVFQLTGAGSNGGQSVRGMPILKALRDSGFSIWPMDPPSQQMVLEVYPRALLQWLRPGAQSVRGDAGRLAFLNEAPVAFWGHDAAMRDLLASTASAFDAAIAAWALWVGRDAIAQLSEEADPMLRREGRIWLPPSDPVIWNPRQPRLGSGAKMDRRSPGAHDGVPIGAPGARPDPSEMSQAAQDDPAPSVHERRIANPHCGNIGDVFKHLLLMQIAESTGPTEYLESHAGAPAYPLEVLDRGPGDALRFLEYLRSSGILQASAYGQELPDEVAANGHYLGSAALVASVLGPSPEYTLFDDHADTISALAGMIDQLGLTGHAIMGDGLTGVLEGAGPRSLTLIDPFRVSSKGPGGLNSADVFTMLARAPDRTTVLWYPVVVPKMKQVWPERISDEVAEPIWRGEVRLPSNALGLNGCGMLVAGIDSNTAERLGELVDAYGAALSGDYPGSAAGHGWDTDEGPFSPWTPFGVGRPAGSA